MLFGDIIFFFGLLSAVVTAFVLSTGHYDPAETLPLGAKLVTLASIASTILATIHIFFHLRHWSHPRRQRNIVRILFLVPVYAIDSLWAYYDRFESSLVSVARDTYEAFAIQSFFWLILDIAEDHGLYEYWRKEHPTFDHLFPLRGKMQLNRDSVKLWRVLVLQYTILSPLLTLGVFLLHHFDLYDEASWQLINAHLYIALLKCVSVTVAFTALMYLYLSSKHLIHDAANPTAKFLSLKFVIFLVCWQGLVIFILEYFNIIPVEKLAKQLLTDGVWRTMNSEELIEATSASLESSLVCFEMLIAVVLHKIYFSYDDNSLFAIGKKTSGSNTNVNANNNKNKNKNNTTNKQQQQKGDQKATKTILVHTSIVTSFIEAVKLDDVFSEMEEFSKLTSPTSATSSTSQTKNKNQQQQQNKQQQKNINNKQQQDNANKQQTTGGKSKTKPQQQPAKRGNTKVKKA